MLSLSGTKLYNMKKIISGTSRKRLNNLGIEIFPREKSCTQACPACFLARHNRPLVPQDIDHHVQESFSLLEQNIGNRRYDLHFAGDDLTLLPKFKKPELVKYFRFNLDTKYLKDFSGIEHKLMGIRKLLKWNKINPTILAFSIVPKNIFISREELLLVDTVITTLKRWHKGEIEALIRSNFEKEEFGTIAKKLYIHERSLLSEVMGGSSKHWYEKDAWSSCYLSEFYDSRQKLRITHRVIKPNESDHVTSVKTDYKNLLFNALGLAITPQGVMLGHSSISVANPLTWMSHDDFTNEFTTRVIKDQIPLLDFRVKLLMENYRLQIHTNFKEASIQDYTLLAEHNREQLKKFSDRFVI